VLTHVTRGDLKQICKRLAKEFNYLFIGYLVVLAYFQKGSGDISQSGE
jgi:hypothetical protein